MTDKTATKIIDVYDPVMCCSTGVCGPDLDDSLVDFANDVKWFKSQGIEVNRYNLGQEPTAFKTNPDVLARLQTAGSEILPIIFVNGKMVSESGYPDRMQLVEWLATPSTTGLNGTGSSSADVDHILTEMEEAVSNGDEAGMRSLFQKGVAQGVSIESIVNAMQAGINNRQHITQTVLQAANELLGGQPAGCKPGGGCC